MFREISEDLRRFDECSECKKGLYVFEGLLETGIHVGAKSQNAVWLHQLVQRLRCLRSI